MQPIHCAQIALVWLAFSSTALGALTPESPEVKRLIAAGMKYLSETSDGRLGGQCLIGLCQYKDTGDAAHPQVVRAVESCQQVCKQNVIDIQTDIYSTGIAIFFLCEVGAEDHSTEIEKLVQSLIHRQKGEGGWGYPQGSHAETGDTSMTQYAVLGLWTAKQHGIEVPQEVVEKVANWLIRTQDPTGGWGYQGKDPGNYVRVPQAEVRKSLTAAGLGSSYICASMLGISNEQEDRQIEGLPPAFQRVPEKPAEDDKLKRLHVDPAKLRGAIADGNRWFARNFSIEKENWVFYYLYAFERYMSFRELVEDQRFANTWYERGVRFIDEQQAANGQWESTSGAAVDTAFAILFLMRGTQKTIEATVDNSREWTVVGGRGLPKNTSNLRVSGGKLVGTPLAKSVEEMLAILEDPKHKDFDYTLEFPPPVDWDKLSPEEYAANVRRWTQLLQEGPPSVRKLAVQSLAKSGRLNVAPVLIEAMRDDDLAVVFAARDGLRRLSRKFEGFGLSNNPTRAEIDVAVEQWRAWYQSIPPE